MSVRCYAAFAAEGDEVEFLGAVMDVTAIRLAENELHKTQADLAHMMRVPSLGELTASIAHGSISRWAPSSSTPRHA